MAAGTTPGKRNLFYCDDCGCELDFVECKERVHSDEGNQKCDEWRHLVGALPIDIETAKAGEAAMLCGPCYRWVFDE
jgi:hypothetical protein